MMKIIKQNIYKTFIMMVLINVPVIIGISCNRPYDEVIEYFEKDNNQEKLEAAKYLIGNLKYQRYFEGEEYDKLLKIYSGLSLLPVSERADTLDLKNQFRNPALRYDSETLTSEFLIKHISLYYDIWDRTPWKKDYDFKYFCEYILPYRSGNEPASFRIQDYHDVWSKHLRDIYFYGGDVYRAADYKSNSHEVLSLNDFDISDLVKLLEETRPLILDNVYSPKTGLAYLRLKYTCCGKRPALRLLINNRDTVTIKLTPTQTKYIYPPQAIYSIDKFGNGF